MTQDVFLVNEPGAREDVRAFLMAFIETGEHVTVSGEINACRDPEDDTFLEPAVSRRADLVLMGSNGFLLGTEPESSSRCGNQVQIWIFTGNVVGISLCLAYMDIYGYIYGYELPCRQFGDNP